MIAFRDIPVKLFAVHRIRSAMTDGLLLTLAAVVLNVLLAKDDIGFTKLSPSPYLLIPVIIGCRHGLRPGLISGIMVTAIRIGGPFFGGGNREWSVDENLWEAVAPPLVGFICGGAVTALIGRLRVLRNEAARLRRTSLMMSAEIRMLRHDTDETIRHNLVEQVRRINLEDDLRALMLRSAEELPDAMMAILRNHAQVREAALYRVTEDDPILQRLRLLGGDVNLPAELDIREYPMLEQSVELSRLTSASVTASIENIVGRPHLIAAPIVYGKGVTHLLVVSDVPLIAFSARTVRLVAIVCKCMEECMAMTRGGESQFRLVPGGLNRRIYTDKAFRRHMATYRKLAKDEMTEWRLCVIRATIPAPDAKRILEDAVMPALDAEDITHSADNSDPVLFIILPWSNRNASLRFEKRLTAELDRAIPELGPVVRLYKNPDEAETERLMSDPDAV